MKVKTATDGTVTCTLSAADKTRLATAHGIAEQLAYHSHDKTVRATADGLQKMLVCACWMHPTTEATPETPAK